MYNYAAQALVGSDLARGNTGLHREVAPPGVPNAMDTSTYTNMNGDAQTPLRMHAMNQQTTGNIVASGSQRAADAIQGVREDVNAASQKEFETDMFLARYMADKLENTAEANVLFEMGMGNPEEMLRSMQASKNMIAGSPSFNVGVPYIPGKNLEGVPNAENMREVLKRKYLKNPGGQTLPKI